MGTSDVAEKATGRTRDMARELGSKKLMKRADKLEKELSKTAKKIERELEKRAKKVPRSFRSTRRSTGVDVVGPAAGACGQALWRPSPARPIWSSGPAGSTSPTRRRPASDRGTPARNASVYPPKVLVTVVTKR